MRCETRSTPGILVTADDGGEAAYTFRHALLREAAYDESAADRASAAPCPVGRLPRTVDPAGSATRASGLSLTSPSMPTTPTISLGRSSGRSWRFAPSPTPPPIGRRSAMASGRSNCGPGSADAQERTGITHADLLSVVAMVSAAAGDPRRAVALDQAALEELEADVGRGSSRGPACRTSSRSHGSRRSSTSPRRPPTAPSASSTACRRPA